MSQTKRFHYENGQIIPNVSMELDKKNIAIFEAHINKCNEELAKDGSPLLINEMQILRFYVENFTVGDCDYLCARMEKVTINGAEYNVVFISIDSGSDLFFYGPMHQLGKYKGHTWQKIAY